MAEEATAVNTIVNTISHVAVSPSADASIPTAAIIAVTTGMHAWNCSCLCLLSNVRMFTAVSTTISETVISSKRCPKCGTVKKSGKLSCCARNGAWFKKCGDAGDSNFNHTWVEGVQACNSFGSPLLTKAPVRVMLLHKKITTQSANKTWPSNPDKHHVNIYPTRSIFNADTADSEDYDKPAEIAALVSFWFTTMYL